ncbi:MAG: APC family permease [Solirubrobacteraceae bacterium]
MLVAIGVVTNVPLNVLKGLGDSGLAVAAKPSLGQAGFRLIAIAALLSTASAVNATLFGSTNIAYQVAKNGSLPPAFDRKLWRRDVEGLFITAGIVLVFVLIFPLSAVASMGSAGFLLVYAAVSIGHMRIRKQTGAKAWPIVASAVTCRSLFARPALPHDHHSADISDRSRCHARGQLPVRDPVSPHERADFQGNPHADQPRPCGRRADRSMSGVAPLGVG